MTVTDIPQIPGVAYPVEVSEPERALSQGFPVWVRWFAGDSTGAFGGPHGEPMGSCIVHDDSNRVGIYTVPAGCITEEKIPGMRAEAIKLLHTIPLEAEGHQQVTETPWYAGVA